MDGGTLSRSGRQAAYHFILSHVTRRRSGCPAHRTPRPRRLPEFERGFRVFKRRKPDDMPGIPPAPRPDGASPAGDAGATGLLNGRRVDDGSSLPPFRNAVPYPTSTTAKEAPAMGRSPFPAPPPPPNSNQGQGPGPGMSSSVAQSGPGGIPSAPRPGNAAGQRREQAERRTLVVGRGISVQGTVTDAERLVVEGTFEASIVHATELVIAPGGMFKGEVEVEDTEVAGTIDGTLTARGNLIVRSTGKLLGTARCRRLQVEDGGQITGRMEMITEPARSEPAPAMIPTRSVSEPLPGA